MEHCLHTFPTYLSIAISSLLFQTAEIPACLFICRISALWPLILPVLMLAARCHTIRKIACCTVPATMRSSIPPKGPPLCRGQHKPHSPRSRSRSMPMVRLPRIASRGKTGRETMEERQSYLIIGNGIAGVTAAEILRAEDAAADITVVADAPFPVYYRPALKDYLAGRVREDKLWARPNSFYQQQNIRFVSGRVVRIQVGQHSVQLGNGQEVGYSRLLLASGARPARLTCPGSDLPGVCTLRTVADYQTVLDRLKAARRVVVSGSGTLALETIETLRHRGYSVIHLLRRRTLWSEVLDATASDLVLQQERRDGVEVHLEEEIAEITGKQGQVQGVVTTKGAHIPCDMVIMAIGIEPIVDFIKASGIPCGRGLKVDGAMRTGAPDIYAAGDILETTDATSGRPRLLGQWYQ